MKVDLPAGKYILAVSGGVDSMVLLDLLSKHPGIELVVAHFNHGIRPDADEDEKLVRGAARKYGLEFEAKKVKLGRGTSEEVAREARYGFLDELRQKYQANKIITAHHRDDLIETAIINILRGTGPRGMVAMAGSTNILRPLLYAPKSEIIEYAKANSVAWREDFTNQEVKYLRNYVRHNLTSKMDEAAKRKILDQIESISKVEQETAAMIRDLAREVMQDGVINRAKFIDLPLEIGSEVLVYWLRELGIREFDRKTIARLLIALKTAKPGTRHNVMKGISLIVGAKTANFENNR